MKKIISFKKDLGLYIRLLTYARPYWKVVIISILAMVLSAALEPALPALMKPLVDNNLIARNDANLWTVPLLLVLAFVGKGFADYTANVSSQIVAQKVMADLRRALFEHQLSLPVSRHRAEEPGRMLTRITYDTTMVGDAVSTAWLTIVKDSLVITGLLAFLFYTAWQLALLVLIIAPALSIIIKIIGSKLRHFSEGVQKSMGRVTSLIEDSLIGLQEIKIFSAEYWTASRFDKENISLRRQQTRSHRIQALNVPLVQILAAVSVALVIFTATELNKSQLLSPGEFVAFITAMSMIFEPVRRLTNINVVLQKGMAAAESIFKLLDDSAEGVLWLQNDNTIDKSELYRGPKKTNSWSIDFQNVSYKYPGTEKYSIKDLSFSIKDDCKTAIIGPSGSGKSTIASLICGLDYPTLGEILLGGIDIRNMCLSNLRQQVSVVGQGNILFDMSLGDNLRLASPDASDERIWDTLRLANADDFVRKLPQGLDSPMGLLGNKLSGGERQRIAIARALLKSAPILILDEITSAQHYQSTEKLIVDLFGNMNLRTVVWITHDKRLLPNFDAVIDLTGR